MKYLSHLKRKTAISRLFAILVAALALSSWVVPAIAAPMPAANVAAVQQGLAYKAVSKNCTTATALASRPTLKYGDRGSCVSVLQQNLMNRGYSLGVKAPTGAFLTNTKAAVIKFQKANKLAADGIVGPKTWAKLGLGQVTTAPKPAPAGSAPVVLTYDDCPANWASAKQTLQDAANMKIHLRIYVTGNCLKAKKFDVATARNLGHTVCSHSNTHADLTKLSKAGVRKEMDIAGLKTDCGRPPYGAVNATVKAVFKEKGMSLDLWGVDTNDWRGKSQAQVVDWVVTKSKPGSVVLMHMQHKGFNKSALTAIKTGLSKRGIAVK